MEKEQEQFLLFLLECVQEGKEETAKAMLLQNFKKQQEGNFTASDLQNFHEEIVKVLKPERKDEVIAIMNQFGGDHVNR